MATFETGDAWLLKNVTGLIKPLLRRGLRLLLPTTTIIIIVLYKPYIYNMGITLDDLHQKVVRHSHLFSTSRDRLVNFVETLTNKHPTFHVIEEIVTTNREMNTSVQICAKDGTILYDVPNIRKLKKVNQRSNTTNDAVVDDIVAKIVEYYTNFFQYIVPKEKLTFGFSDDEDETFEINQYGSVSTTALVLAENTNNNNDNNNQNNNTIVKKQGTIYIVKSNET